MSHLLRLYDDPVVALDLVDGVPDAVALDATAGVVDQGRAEPELQAVEGSGRYVGTVCGGTGIALSFFTTVVELQYGATP